MATKNGQGNPDDKDKDSKMEYEYIDESEISGVRRGRKRQIIEDLVQFLAKVPNGKAVQLNKFQIDSALDAESVKKMKASIASVLRNQAKYAGWNKVSISWSESNIPFLKKIS